MRSLILSRFYPNLCESMDKVDAGFIITSVLFLAVFDLSSFETELQIEFLNCYGSELLMIGILMHFRSCRLQNDYC